MTLLGWIILFCLVGGALSVLLAASLLFLAFSPLDPLVNLVVVLLLVVTGLIAVWVPTWRVARIEPMLALRRE